MAPTGQQFGVRGLGFGVAGSGIRVWGFGFRVWGLIRVRLFSEFGALGFIGEQATCPPLSVFFFPALGFKVWGCRIAFWRLFLGASGAELQG